MAPTAQTAGRGSLHQPSSGGSTAIARPWLTPNLVIGHAAQEEVAGGGVALTLARPTDGLDAPGTRDQHPRGTFVLGARSDAELAQAPMAAVAAAARTSSCRLISVHSMKRVAWTLRHDPFCHSDRPTDRTIIDPAGASAS